MAKLYFLKQISIVVESRPLVIGGRLGKLDSSELSELYSLSQNIENCTFCVNTALP